MNEAELTKWILETKIELETLRTMLIQRGKLNSMEFESLKKKIAEEMTLSIR
ncbi:50S ribosomal protein L29 [Ammoniphilus sp. 3BR4]|uniref:50S ribosomal protein L29 n=1 Tax=Ammoniphilus sp. 3BR4 TaxID=3158265 RepID=UPI003465249F